MATGASMDRNPSVSSVRNVSLTDLWKPALIAIVGSILANLVIAWVAVELFGAPSDDLPLSTPPIIMATIIGVVGAVAVYWGIGRFSSRPLDRTFRTVAIAILLVSMLFPLPAPDISGTTKVALIAMHIASGIITILALTPWARRD